MPDGGWGQAVVETGFCVGQTIACWLSGLVLLFLCGCRARCSSCSAMGRERPTVMILARLILYDDRGFLVVVRDHVAGAGARVVRGAGDAVDAGASPPGSARGFDDGTFIPLKLTFATRTCP